MSNKKVKRSLINALFFAFPWKYQKYSLSLHQEKTKGYIMDKRFTPRTNEELQKAVESLRAHLHAMNTRLKSKI